MGGENLGRLVIGIILFSSLMNLHFVSADLPHIIGPSIVAGSGGGGSGGLSNVTQVSSGSGYIVISPTTGNVVVTLSGAQLNDTISRFGVAAGFNASGSGGTINIFDQQLNSTFRVSFLAANITTLNVSTINNFFDADCPSGNYSFGIQSNGTLKCANDVSGSSGGTSNIFDQQLNSTFRVTFLGANITTLNVSTINQFFDADCPSATAAFGIGTNGTFKCRTFVEVETDPIYTADMSAIVFKNIANNIDGGTQVISDSSFGFPLSIRSFSPNDRVDFSDDGFGQFRENFYTAGVLEGWVAPLPGSFRINGVTQTQITSGALGGTVNVQFNETENEFKLLSVFDEYVNFVKNLTYGAGADMNVGGNFLLWNTTFGKIDPINHVHNGTGVLNTRNSLGLVIPHQDFDITGVTALNTRYNNTLDRPIEVQVNVKIVTSLLGDFAYANLTKGFVNNLQDYQSIGTFATTGAIGETTFQSATMTVQPGQQWAINSSVTGSGAVTLQKVWKTIL